MKAVKQKQTIVFKHTNNPLANQTKRKRVDAHNSINKELEEKKSTTVVEEFFKNMMNTQTLINFKTYKK